MVASMEELAKDKHYTYTDYVSWGDSVRYELIDGTPYMLAAPSWKHQRISGELYLQLATFLKGKPCRVFTAPFDVRLNAEENDDTVVQPDLVVVCDRSKLGGTGYQGSPDMIIEILSPSSARHDLLIKLQLYQKVGVVEYWIVDLERKVVSVHTLENGKYMINTYGDTDTISVQVLNGCQISLQDVFEDIED
ncbi:MAG: Uma2 family endonuclease [Peptococcaceae bacterium]|nr:Uma2 family endonuclease [Peptococcaceae bacterium]